MNRPTFGVDRDPAVVARIGPRKRSGAPASNPCIAAFGPIPVAGPEKCGDCAKLYAVGGTQGRYLKCSERGRDDGATTDHFARWPACARFVRRDDAQEEPR